MKAVSKEMTLAGDDKFGEVIVGTISVTGKMLPCTMSQYSLITLGGGPPLCANFFPDHDGMYSRQIRHVECLFLAYHDGSNVKHHVGFSSDVMAALMGDGGPRYFGLVLQRISGLDTRYYRVGMAIAESNRENFTKLGAEEVRRLLSCDDCHISIV